MKLPILNTEQEESDFWDTHDSTDYFDDTEEVDVTFIDVRPRMEQISLRLPSSAIASLKFLANRKGIGYQTLIRMWVMERLEQEIAAQHAAYDAARPLPEEDAKKAPKERQLA
jgi:predicted DNA binding CopG/RHH family protein